MVKYFSFDENLADSILNEIKSIVSLCPFFLLFDSECDNYDE